jgi:PQQ-like domain
VALVTWLPPAAEGGARPGRLIPIAGAETIAFGAGAVWVTTPRMLVRIDPVRRRVVARIRIPHLVASAAVDGKDVWVLTNPTSTSPHSDARSSLYSVEIATDRIVGAPIHLFPMAQGQLVVARGSLWVTNDNHGPFGRLFRIDRMSRTVAGAVRVPGDPRSVVLADRSLWVGASDSGRVVRVDPSTGTVEGRPIRVGGALLELAADRGKIWVADTYSGRLVTIDASTGSVIVDRPLAGLGGIAASRGTVWTVSRNGDVAAFDAASGRRTLTPSRIRGGADAIVTSGTSVWVINHLGITPLRDP